MYKSLFVASLMALMLTLGSFGSADAARSGFGLSLGVPGGGVYFGNNPYAYNGYYGSPYRSYNRGYVYRDRNPYSGYSNNSYSPYSDNSYREFVD